MSDIYVIGDTLVIESGECNCAGGFETYGHEPYCGIDPIAFEGEWSPTILWDMSEIRRPWIGPK